MIKLWFGLISGILLGLVLIKPVLAIENPLAAPNNRYGIHLVDQNDIPQAKDLINSNGGDWGYVTIVIRQSDRDREKWQRIFDQLREAHLIPLLRLATQPEGNNWQAPKPEDAADWADFLDSLNWVVKNRYVILFNEPNHAKEWGGSVKPQDFAAVVRSFSQALKAKSADFFILPGAVDSSSPDSSGTMSPKQFYQWMRAGDPEIFKLYDGLASHSYPHPDFVGKVTDRGAGSITAYRWEQDYLSKLGLAANLPVFITETGWAHTVTSNSVRPALKPETVSKNYQQAFTKIWTDSQIVAITPFIFNYQDTPFAQFSWLMPGGNDKYPQFEAVQALPKISGEPVQVHLASLTLDQIPEQLVSGSTYHLSLEPENIGQTPWDPTKDQIIIQSQLLPKNPLVIALPVTKIFDSASIPFILNTPLKTGSYPIKVYYRYLDQDPILVTDSQVQVINPPSLIVSLELWYKRVSSGNDFTLLIYQANNLIKKIPNFQVINGQGQVARLTDVIPHKEYRFVLTKPYYLPRQTFAVLNDDVTQISFKRMLPLDLNLDGKLSLADLGAFFRHPLLAINLWVW